MSDKHTCVRGWGRGCDAPLPPESPKQVPSPEAEKWEPITKNPWSIQICTPFLDHFHWTYVSSSNKTDNSQQKAIDWKIEFYLTASNFLFCVKNLSPLHPPFTQASCYQFKNSEVRSYKLAQPNFSTKSCNFFEENNIHRLERPYFSFKFTFALLIHYCQIKK